MLGDDQDPPGLGERAQREGREDADGPRADHQHRRARFDSAPHDGMDGTGQRLDQHGVIVSEVVRHGVQLRSVGHEHTAPAASGVRAVPRLEPGRHMPDRDAITSRRLARGAGRARLDPARRARQHRLQDDPGSRGETVDVVQEVGHDLVPGDEGHRDER